MIVACPILHKRDANDSIIYVLYYIFFSSGDTILNSGVFNSGENHQAQNRVALEDFLGNVLVAALSNEVAREYGRMRARLKQQRTLIGPNDLWIAAHAVCLGLPLVIANTREFMRVENLELDNWVSK